MKISAILSLLKKSKTICIYKKGLKQWIGDGCSAYDVSFLPELDAATVFALAGIPEKSQDDFTVKEYADWIDVFDADEGDRSNELTANPFMNFQCIFRGKEVRPFGCDGTVYLYDSKYFKPFENMKDADTLIYSCYFSNGTPLLLVRYGMILVGIINTMRISELAAKELFTVASGLSELSYKEEKADD